MGEEYSPFSDVAVGLFPHFSGTCGISGQAHRLGAMGADRWRRLAEWTDRVAFEAALDTALAEASFENEYTVRYFKRSLGQPAEAPP